MANGWATSTHARPRGRLARAVVVATAVLVVLGACSGSTTSNSSSPAEARTIDATMTTSDGRVRSYRVYLPASLPRDRPVPLLLALHGGVGSGPQFERTSGFDALAETHAFVVVYPNGTEIGGDGPLARGHVWNGGRCCGPAVAAGVDDVGFLSRLIEKVATRYDIDAARVYAVGHSNGAIMAYRLACERSTTIAAIGVQAGSLEVDACPISRPVSLIHIHGTADLGLPIGGGKGSGISAVEFHRPIDAIETIARADDCPSASSSVVSGDNPDVTIERWQPCRAGSDVEFVKVNGASHAWMGHPSPRAGVALTGEPYAGYDSSAAILAFLAAHPRDAE